MAEVRLPAPVTATLVKELLGDRWSDSRQPGSYAAGGDPMRLWYVCPCGCGSLGGLRVYAKGTPPPQPKQEPTWEWDEATATLSPSINHIGHWHGWFQNGTFVQA